MSGLFEQIFASTNIFITAKDRLGRYIYCNEKVAEAVGLDSPHQILGKTDHALCWRKQAKLYIDGDHIVMSGNPLTNVIEPQNQIDGFKKILISKLPLLNNLGECIGVTGSYVNVSKYFIKRKPIDVSCLKGKRFFLGQIFGGEYLTRREMEVLKCVVLGMSVKQIACNLKISPRTVEAHLTRLKIKLQCHTMGDIIMTAIKTGLTFSILDIDSWESCV